VFWQTVELSGAESVRCVYPIPSILKSSEAGYLKRCGVYGSPLLMWGPAGEKGGASFLLVKGIVSRDWGGLLMVSVDR
jgi:hypothetical protein